MSLTLSINDSTTVLASPQKKKGPIRESRQPSAHTVRRCRELDKQADRARQVILYSESVARDALSLEFSEQTSIVMYFEAHYGRLRALDRARAEALRQKQLAESTAGLRNVIEVEEPKVRAALSQFEDAVRITVQRMCFPEKYHNGADRTQSVCNNLNSASTHGTSYLSNAVSDRTRWLEIIGACPFLERHDCPFASWGPATHPHFVKDSSSLVLMQNTNYSLTS